MPSPPEERDPSVPPPGSAEEALRRLEQRLDRASEAAERLMAQAAAEAARAANPGEPPGDPSGVPGGGGEDPGEPVKPPPAGWQIPGNGHAGLSSELDPFVALVQALRDLIPPELQRRLVAALRELLLALRALIDWYLERLERQREQSVEVQDIPIL
jgi:hypothetical protein